MCHAQQNASGSEFVVRANGVYQTVLRAASVYNYRCKTFGFGFTYEMVHEYDFTSQEIP